ncbi:MAG: NUDIX hydrolase [Pseudomonadota bacterium]
MNNNVDNKTASFIECVGGLIIFHDKILLGLRALDSELYPGVWDVFGGHVESGETLEEALSRECREELDITPKNISCIGTFLEPDPQRNGNRRYHFFKITSWSGPGPRLCGLEHSEIQWYNLDDALRLKLAAPEYRKILRENLTL